MCAGFVSAARTEASGHDHTRFGTLQSFLCANQSAKRSFVVQVKTLKRTDVVEKMDWIDRRIFISLIAVRGNQAAVARMDANVDMVSLSCVRAYTKTECSCQRRTTKTKRSRRASVSSTSSSSSSSATKRGAWSSAPCSSITCAIAVHAETSWAPYRRSPRSSVWSLFAQYASLATLTWTHVPTPLCPSFLSSAVHSVRWR